MFAAIRSAPPCRRIPTETAFSPGCRPMFSRSISCRATNNAATAALCPARRFYYTKNHELCKHNERILRGYPRKKIKNRRREVRGASRRHRIPSAKADPIEWAVIYSASEFSVLPGAGAATRGKKQPTIAAMLVMSSRTSTAIMMPNFSGLPNITIF